MFYKVATLSYLIDRLFGEFMGGRHPVIYMGNYIRWFEDNFYRDSTIRGAILTSTLTIIIYLISHTLTILIGSIGNGYVQIFILSIIGSISISTKMLHDSVKGIIENPEDIRYLVSRDTENMSLSDRYKSAIESYSENLSDGVVAPLIYLALFGIDGAFIYKGINTLDSMVGYRTPKYEKFGKVSAILDDILNYIPARVTALLIALLMGSRDAFFKFYHFGKGHDSPNSGHPISAMALSIGVKLGGNTYYFGELKEKPHFGLGKLKIDDMDILRALSFTHRLDILIICTLLYELL
ncbi:MAG: cobalamin biosynthesis protein CobD [Epsilonproteobacteria bacterium]|nr:cobalamin biosynthesis protein CobD [Campylobacterota bacterium]